MACCLSPLAVTLLVCWLCLGPAGSNILTPLIEKGLVEQARNESRRDILGVESYSGYFTVDPRYDSNMFFWFFPSQKGPEAPVLLWLNGGPGRSSLYGALLENGPLALNANGTLERREVSWSESFSMLYIDNPVGTGYSYTTDDRGFSRSMDDIATNLYSALIQFFKLFPRYADNDVYIGGQSYAGKYIPPLGYHIHNRNHDASSPPEVLINMKGIYMGGAFCDPVTMAPAFFDYLFNMGVISDTDRQRFQEDLQQFLKKALSGEINPTFDEYFSNLVPYADLALDDFDNILGGQATWSPLVRIMDPYLQTPSTATQLGAAQDGQPTFDEQNTAAVDKLTPDFLNNTLFHNDFLLRHYKVLHYSGNLDVVVSVPMTEAFLHRLHWPLDVTLNASPLDNSSNTSSQDNSSNTSSQGYSANTSSQDNSSNTSSQGYSANTSSLDYRTASRKGWEVNEELAGWYTTVGNLTRVIVRNAGHAVPYDQPRRALAMMTRFAAGSFD